MNSHDQQTNNIDQAIQILQGVKRSIQTGGHSPDLVSEQQEILSAHQGTQREWRRSGGEKQLKLTIDWVEEYPDGKMSPIFPQTIVKEAGELKELFMTALDAIQDAEDNGWQMVNFSAGFTTSAISLSTEPKEDESPEGDEEK